MKFQTKHSAQKALESACPKFITEHYPNLDTYDAGLSSVISSALNALGTTYTEHHQLGEFQFSYDEEFGFKVNFDEPENHVNPKYIAIQEMAIFERRLTERRKNRPKPPKKVLKKLERESNGMGSGFAQIAVVVEKPYHEKVEGLETEWAVIAEDEKTMTFQYDVKNNYKGDDETIIHSLWDELPKEIIDGGYFKVDWDKSGY